MYRISHALIDYWHRLPGTSVAGRTRALEQASRGVRSGELPPDALVPYAIADPDEDVAFAAAAQYLESAGTGERPRGPAIDDAVEWIRRHLALNRGAVFAAILGRGDPAINARLLALRLTLSADEVATISRRVACRPCDHSRDFLRGWLELLEGEGTESERVHLARALGDGVTARAA